MYLLDTNVVSELRKAKTGKADRHMIVWANAVQASSLFLSAITILELELGVLLVERRDPVQGGVLRSWLDTHVLPAFAGRVPADRHRGGTTMRSAARAGPAGRTGCTDCGDGTGARHGSRNAERQRFRGDWRSCHQSVETATSADIGHWHQSVQESRQTDREIGSDASVAASLRAPFLRSIAQAVVSYPSSPACTAHPARNPASAR